jgi:cytochrome c1
VYKRKTRDEMITWISDPQKLKPGTPMPRIDMTREQLNEIVDFLLSLASVPPPASTQPRPPTTPLPNLE